jgi:hypothetical protein
LSTPDTRLVEDDVLPGEADRLPDAEPGDGQEPDQGLVGAGEERDPERSGSGHDRLDLGVAAEVGSCTRRPARQAAGRRDLALFVEAGGEGGEEPHDAEALREPARARAGRERGEGERVLGRDHCRALVLEEVEELPEQALVGDELVTGRAAEREVAGENLSQAGRHHSLPGQGRARAARRARSTLA